MFRSASEIDAERTGVKVREIQASWEGSADSWFDGSVDAVDRRLGECNRLIGYARAASVRLLHRPESADYIRLAHQLESDQDALTQMRHDLLYAAADREPPRYTLPSHRIAVALRPEARRWVELEAQNFVADNTDVFDDAHELHTRAANFAELHTSTLSPKESRVITAAFVQRVAEVHEAGFMEQAASVRTASRDFPDELMFLEG